MEIKNFTLISLDRVLSSVRLTLDGMTAEQLTYRPHPEANSVAWVMWHLTRGLDRRVAMLDGAEQTWVADRLYEQFNLPADPDDYGVGHNAEQVAAVRPRDASLLLDYYESVHGRMREFLDGLQPNDVDRPVADPSTGERSTVGNILADAVNGNLQHIGQAGYIRGLIEGRRWFPR